MGWRGEIRCDLHRWLAARLVITCRDAVVASVGWGMQMARGSHTDTTDDVEPEASGLEHPHSSKDHHYVLTRGVILITLGPRPAVKNATALPSIPLHIL